ncbi:hypothetical protein JCM14076_24100 [Methylosoma difficile]
MLGNSVLCLATTCGDSTPEELIRETDLIFKGKVIGTKILFLDKYDITDGFEKISTQSEIDKSFNYQELIKLIKPYVNAKDFQKLTENPHFILKELISSRTKFKMLVLYKGPIVDEIEVESASGKIGEENMVFAYGNLREGFKGGRRQGFSYFYPSNEANRLRYQNALDVYREKREQLTTALQLSPHNLALLREQGAFYLQYHDLNSAQWVYQELRLHHPKEVAGLVGLAEVKFHRTFRKAYFDNKAKTEFEQVLTDYQNILKIDRNNHAARHGETLSLLYLERGSEVDKNVRDFSGYVNYSEKTNDFFAGRNLVGANFRNAQLSDFNFSKADLRHADFSGASLWNCDFTGAMLANASFRNLQKAHRTKFISANLQHADFTGAKLEDMDFHKADLKGADFTEAYLEVVDFRNADLRGGNFSKAGLYRSPLNSAKLNNVKFNNAHVCIDSIYWPIGFNPLLAGVKNCK